MTKDCRTASGKPSDEAKLVVGSLTTRRLCWALIGLLLGGCAALPQPEVDTPLVTRPDDYPMAFYRQEPGSRIFLITDSKLTLKTFRAGWLKGLAHAHVMTTDTLTGLIYVDPDGSTSRSDLFFRPYDLVLDDPQERAAAGPEFASERSAEDIAATRLRMLGPRQLDSNAFPFIRVQVLPADHADQVLLRITLRNHVASKTVPLQWQIAADRLLLTADFALTHKELGLKPYSAFAGALAVADRIEVSLTLAAQRTSTLPADALTDWSVLVGNLDLSVGEIALSL